MYTLGLVCLATLFSVVLGDPVRGPKPKRAAHHKSHHHGYGYPFPPFPWFPSPSEDPSVTPTSFLSTGSITDPTSYPISASATTTGPYGNSTTILTGTAPGSGGSAYTSYDPNATSITASGQPSPSANATTDPFRSNPTTYGTVSAAPVTASNITDPGYPYPTHGPYPFPTSRKSYDPSGTAGTGISLTATGINVTSLTSDPLASRPSPTHGPYTRSSGLVPYPYSILSTFVTIGTTVSSLDPSASLSIIANATTDPGVSGTGFSYSASLSTDPSFTGSVTNLTSAGSGTIIPAQTSTSDPYANVTTSAPYYSSGTGFSIGTGSYDPLTVTSGVITGSDSTTFSYTPTVKSQPSEYYYHHRKPHHASYYEG
ncbi:hypothetical protein ACLMJK_008115 [Lecanora helva]